MGDERDVEPQIMRVELVEQSYKSHRLKNGLDPGRFPVIVWFTRPVNIYQKLELAKRGWDIHFTEFDAMQALIETTPDEFEQTIGRLSNDLPAVMADARRARADAEAEDEHIAALVSKINLKLSPEKWSDD